MRRFKIKNIKKILTLRTAVVCIAAAAVILSLWLPSVLSANIPETEDAGPLLSVVRFNINMPENAALTVSDIRARGFTLSWTDLGGGYDYQYAVAVSHSGNIQSYAAALANGNIILDFTPGSELGGTHKITGLTSGRFYDIRIFARAKNTLPAYYLSGRTLLPHVGEAELFAVYLDGEPMEHNFLDDSFTKLILPGKTPIQEYTVTYNLMRNCVLHIDGEIYEPGGEFKIRDGETVFVTVFNGRLNAARDYIISVRPLDNGLPVVYINTEDSRVITSRNIYVPAHIEISGSASNPVKSYAGGLYSGGAGIRIRGSLSSPKPSYNIKTPADENKAQILDMHPSRDWMLWSAYTDKSLMRKYIAHELYRDMGADFSPKLRFAELILNGEYMGVYLLGERVKIDKGRLDLPKISMFEKFEYTVRRKGTLAHIIPPTSGEDLSGSYIIQLKPVSGYSREDIIFETGRLNWTSGSYFSIDQPGLKNMSPEAYDYISGYMRQTENALFAENFRDPDEGYRKYIDTGSFIDWYIVNELFMNAKADFTNNIYFYKPRHEKLRMGPVWDFDHSAGNADYIRADGGHDGWHVRNALWFARLFEDEAFALEFEARWNFVKENYLDNIFAKIDATAALLERAQTANFGRWPILGAHIPPNAGGASRRRTYQNEVSYLKDWLAARIEWIDGEINNINR
jgi:hypothetical protein